MPVPARADRTLAGESSNREGTQMPYTVWSRGRLIGESELAYARSLPGVRAGDFAPSELGDRLMPIITGVGPALSALHDVADEVRLLRPAADRPGDWPEGVRQTTEYADAISLHDELASLELELRDPAGAVVKTDWIAIQDTHRLLALAHDDSDDHLIDVELTDEELRSAEEMRAELEALDWDDREPWEGEQPEFPRYQILLMLAGFDKRLEKSTTRKRT